MDHALFAFRIKSHLLGIICCVHIMKQKYNCFSRCCPCVWKRKTSFPTSLMCSRTQTWLFAWLSATTSLVLKSCSPASSTPSSQQGITQKLPRWQPMHPRYFQCTLRAEVKQRDITHSSSTTSTSSDY